MVTLPGTITERSSVFSNSSGNLTFLTLNVEIANSGIVLIFDLLISIVLLCTP